MSGPFAEPVLAVAAGVTFLWIFYFAIRIDWPEQYFTTTDFSAYAISSSPVRYSLFRFAPVFVTCAVVAVSLDRVGSPIAPQAAVAVGIIHGCATLGVALVRWARSDQKQRAHRASIAIIRAVALVGIVFVSVLAAVGRGAVAFLIPEVRELGSTLWTAGFAAVAGAFVVQYTRSHGISDTTLVARALRSLPQRLRDLAADECKATGADIDLVVAIMAVENLQRPPWFRSLERLKSRAFKSGTYGIMQVASPVPLSDEESIRVAVRERLAKVNVRDRRGFLDPDAMKRFASEYNGGPTYVSTLSNAYYTARSQRPGAVTPSVAAASASDSVLRHFKRPEAIDQCLLCGKVLTETEPAVAMDEKSMTWVVNKTVINAPDIVLAHPRCYALFRGIEGLARLKRNFDVAVTGGGQSGP